MSNLQLNMVPTEPNLIDLLNIFKKQINLDFSAHHIGTIKSFDPSNQTASAIINYKKTNFVFNAVSGAYENQLSDWPPIGQAPVIVLGGAKGYLSFPIASGDECLILFNDRDMDNWFAGSSASENSTLRLHSFSDAVIIVGLRSLPNVLTTYDPSRVVLGNGTTMVAVGETLIKIQNASQNLNSILQNLISTLSSLQTTPTIPGNPATLDPSVILQLTEIGMDLGLLLE